MGELNFLLFWGIVGVAFVNGWTDAPNAILSVVCSKALSYRKAVLLAAVCNLLGVGFFALWNHEVADTISQMITLEGTPVQSAVTLLCGMLAVIFYGIAGWWFGIPTSESHGLIAGLTGAALAFGSLGSINWAQWGKVLWGLVLSLGLGWGMGWALTLLLYKPFRRLGAKVLNQGQILTAALMAFLHSAQDGLKFVGVFILMNTFAHQRISMLQAVLVTALAITAGTLVGGKRIINHVGTEMVAVTKETGLASDIAAVVCLWMATLLGLPVSTTHTKTMAVVGAVCSTDKNALNCSILKEMVFGWAFTFPACGGIGYLLAIFMRQAHF